MDNLHRQYLDMMGVDVYTIRTISDTFEGNAENATDISTKAEASLETPKQVETPNRVETPKSVEALRQQLKDQVLSEGPETVVVVAKSLAQQREKETKNSAPKDKLFVKNEPRFFFCFLDYDDISLMVSLPVKANNLPREYRQLCDDIVFALVKERKIPKVRELRWPMVTAAHIQQNADDARLIIGDMVSQCGSNLILFGEVVASYRSEKKQGTYLLLEELDHYMSNPKAKPELWAKLLPLLSVR
ncbi:MAG: hypothetical protein ACI9CE_001026 [Flavobacterium sp.]|jgi:hypothetical protein